MRIERLALHTVGDDHSPGLKTWIALAERQDGSVAIGTCGNDVIGERLSVERASKRSSDFRKKVGEADAGECLIGIGVRIVGRHADMGHGL